MYLLSHRRFFELTSFTEDNDRFIMPLFDGGEEGLQCFDVADILLNGIIEGILLTVRERLHPSL